MASTPQYETFLLAQQQKKYHILEVQVSAFRDLFSDPSIPLSNIAKRVSGPHIEGIQKQLRGERSHGVCGAFWSTFEDAVKTLTSFNDRLVDFLIELQKVEDPTGFFTEMCEFKAHWLEFAFNWRDPSSKDPERDAKRQEWINLNSFSAKLSTRNVPELDERDRSAFIMRHTLEKTPWDYPPEITADPEDFQYQTKLEYEMELHDVRKLDTWIPAAAAWIRISPRGLYQMAVEERPMYTERDWIPTNWKGKKGWSKERWAFWRERFEAIGGIPELEERTRKLAREAASTMRRVEEESGA